MKKYKCVLKCHPFLSCEVFANTIGEAQVKGFNIMRKQVPTSCYIVLTDVSVMVLD